MSKKNFNVYLKHLIQSHLEDANTIKKENTKKNEAFQTSAEELRKKIRSSENQFNDI